MSTHDQQLGLRLPRVVLERLDRLAEQMRQERPGLRLSRSDVARMLILQGLETADKAALAEAMRKGS